MRKYWTKNALGKTMAALLLMANLSQPAANASTSAPTEDFGVIPGTVESYDSTAEEILSEAAALKNFHTSVDSELSFFGNKGPYTIVSQWTDKNGKLVYLREKARAKNQNKHGLSIRASQASTKYAPKIKRSGDRYEYRLPMDHISCSGWGPFKKCRKVETTDILTVVGFNKIRDGKPYGVVTTHCLGYQGRCPQWIINSPQIK